MVHSEGRWYGASDQAKEKLSQPRVQPDKLAQLVLYFALDLIFRPLEGLQKSNAPLNEMQIQDATDQGGIETPERSKGVLRYQVDHEQTQQIQPSEYLDCHASAQ
jgi:hypothetical protein